MMSNVIQLPNYRLPHPVTLEKEAGELIERCGKTSIPWEVEQDAAAALCLRYPRLSHSLALEMTKAAWLARAGL